MRARAFDTYRPAYKIKPTHQSGHQENHLFWYVISSLLGSKYPLHTVFDIDHTITIHVKVNIMSILTDGVMLLTIVLKTDFGLNVPVPYNPVVPNNQHIQERSGS